MACKTFSFSIPEHLRFGKQIAEIMRMLASLANIRDASIYCKADRNPEKFWGGFAKELTWFKPWKKVLDWKPPKTKWFVGGKLNASVARRLVERLDGKRPSQNGLLNRMEGAS